MGHCMFLRKGETHTAPLSGILASDIAVGSTVKLMENGTEVDYLVVNQGIPGGSSLYDASCDGTWVLRKDLYESRAWHSSDKNIYSSSTIHSYLNSTFFNLLGKVEQAAIKQVKIPYCVGNKSSTVNSGSSGLSANIFLLSGYEAGFTKSITQYYPLDGETVSYFDSGIDTSANNKRIAYLNGTAAIWWLRSPHANSNTSAFQVGIDGSYSSNGCSQSYGIRPALILPSTALFDKTTLILKGVA